MNEKDTERNEAAACEVPRLEWGCPVISMCGGMFRKGPPRFFAMLPGVVLILVGIAILFEPQVAIWLVAGAVVLVGLAMLLMVTFMRRLMAKARSAGW